MIVFEPLATAVLPLAATLPRVSVTAQFSVSADGALVVKASWKVLPEAKIRVPSALGVSAEIVALPEPADVAGAVQLNFAVGLAVTVKAAEPPVLFVPLDPLDPLVLFVPLLPATFEALALPLPVLPP
ncbi:hypothetical protein [Paraburkholderia fungorum]|uniref:hypothetical protein n=1 Tax=Paraburkholderia fungorum TaxID=134537 RepID=UPI0038B99544